MAERSSMRIGLFTNNYRPLANGQVTSIDTFTQAFRRAGHQTGVVLPAAGVTDRQTGLRLLGLDDGSQLCLSVGRLAKEKNLAFLLHAFHHIVRTLPAARLVLVGDGDERLPLECLTDDLGLRSSVRFVGAVPHERIGEYTRAAGVPVVAVASDAATDLLQGESAGVLCPENPEAFAGVVATLWAAPERRLAMADAGRRIAARFTPEATATTLLEPYGEPLRARRLAPAAARPDALRSTEART